MTKFAFIALITAPICLRAEIEFVGIISGVHENLFALVDSESSESRWVGIADIFRGYSVSSFERGSRHLTLKRDKNILVLSLRLARIREQPNVSGPLSDDHLFEIAYRAAEAGDEEIAEALVAYHDALMRPIRAQQELREAELAEQNDPGDKTKLEKIKKLRRAIASSPQIVDFTRKVVLQKARSLRTPEEP